MTNILFSQPYLGTGMIISAILCSIALDWFLKKKMKAGTARSEHRLPLMILGSILIILGVLGYCWFTQVLIHWAAPIIASGLVGFGFVSVTLSLQSYLVDSFGIHAASAMAASLVLRNTITAFLPLAAPVLFSKIGYGWGGSVLALIALVVLPAPFILYAYGDRLRRRSARLRPRSYMAQTEAI